MLRCVRATALTATTLLFLASTASAWAQAAVHRSFTAKTLRGELTVVQAPEALINGAPVRLAPGVRIRGETNLLLLSASLSGQALLVHYTLEDQTGLVREVWVLNPTEKANQPWPTTLQEAASWRFDPGSQTWSLP